MADITQEFAFLFSAQDLASPTVESAYATVEATVPKMERSIGDFAGEVESATRATGDLIHSSTAGLLSSAEEYLDSLGEFDLDEVFSETAVQKAYGAVKGNLKGIDDALGGVLETAGKVASEVQGAYLATTQEMTRIFADTKEGVGEIASEFVSTVQQDFPGLIKTVGILDSTVTSTFKQMTKGAGLAVDGVRKVGAGFDALSRSMESSGMMGSKMGASLMKGLGDSFGGGGLMSFIIGPIGPVLKLLQPIIDIVQKTLQPAFEILEGVIENAFAPLGATLAQVVRQMEPFITKLIRPLTVMLEQVIMQMAGPLLEALSGVDGAIGPIGKALASIMPMATKIMDAILPAVSKLVPLFTRIVETILPVLVQLFEIWVDLFVGRVEMLMEIVTEVMPDLLDLLKELFPVLMPLVVALAKLSGSLLKAMTPFITITLKVAIKLLQALLPLLKPIIDALVWMAELIEDFMEPIQKFGNLLKFDFVWVLKESFAAAGDMLSGWLKWAWDLFMQYVGFVKKVWTTIIDTLGLGEVAEGIKGIFANILAALKSPIEAIKTVINDYVIAAFNSLITADLPLIGPLKDVKAMKALGLAEIPKLERGALVSDDTVVEVAEAGVPEAVVPLTPEHVRMFVEPVVGEMSLEGLEDLVGVANKILAILEMPLRVRDDKPAVATASRTEAEGYRDLSDAVGIGGLTW